MDDNGSEGWFNFHANTNLKWGLDISILAEGEDDEKLWSNLNRLLIYVPLAQFFLFRIYYKLESESEIPRNDSWRRFFLVSPLLD